MKCTTISNLKNCRLPNGIKHFKLNENIHIYQFDKSEIATDPTINHPNLKQRVGDIFYQNLIDFTCQIAFDEINEMDIFKKPDDYSYLLKSLFSFYWYVEDNSMGPFMTASYLTDSIAFSYSLDGQGVSFHNGTHEDTIITLDNFSKAYYYKLQYDKIASKLTNPVVYPSRPNEIVVNHPKYHYLNHKKTKRIERAHTSLELARNTSFLPFKISNYCSSLEALFNTDKNEVTHQIAERIAHYIGRSKAHKIEIYKNIKAAYGIRSSYLHGAPLKYENLSSLEEFSKMIDTYLRQCLTMIFANHIDIFNDEIKLKAFLLELTF